MQRARIIGPKNEKNGYLSHFRENVRYPPLKEVIPVVFPIQSIQSMTLCNFAGNFKTTVYSVHMHDVPGATLLNDLNI